MFLSGTGLAMHSWDRVATLYRLTSSPWRSFVLPRTQVVDAGDAVRAELREHEQALLEERAANKEVTDQAKLQVPASICFSLLCPDAQRALIFVPLFEHAWAEPSVASFQRVPAHSNWDAFETR